MNAIALILVACLPHTNTCKTLIQRPAPQSQQECNERAMKLQATLAGSIDDAGDQPLQVTCLYAPEDRNGE